MRTFIKLLTTDSQQKNFTFFTFESFSYRDKIIHLVRQCVGVKYLKFVYGEDLWFLFKKYETDLKIILESFIKTTKNNFNIKKDEELNSLISTGIVICNNCLNEPTNLPPINISIENFLKFYLPSDNVPSFGSYEFVQTFITHIKNISFRSPKSFEGKAAILVPYNAMNQYSSWTEVQGQSYDYDIKEIQSHCDKIEIPIDNLSPFLTLLTSIKNSIYQQSMSSVLGLLSSFMIDPGYITDYNGYLTSFYSNFHKITNESVKEPIRTNKEVNTIIYKGCYRVLFDEIENSVFDNINTQCRSVVVMDKRIGYSAPIVNVLTAKNMFWLLSYINQNFSDFLNDNDILTKFIAYFEPKISPDKLHDLIKIFYKLPDVSVRDDSLLKRSGSISLFSKTKSPFKMEADENTTEDEPKKEDTSEEDKDTQTETPDDEKDSSTEKDETPEENDTPDDNVDEPNDETEESEDPKDDLQPDESEETVSDDQPVPEYLLKLSAPPDLNDIMYRMELDRVIGAILKNPPKKLSGEVLKTLKTLRSHLLYLISFQQLKLLINKVNEGV